MSLPRTCPPRPGCAVWPLRWLDTYPRLDVLVNNVGGFWAHRHPTADGLERTFALNHLAPFLLTSLLLDRLTASAPARIVTVSSGAHASGRIDFDDLQGDLHYSGQRAYGQSKLANVMFTYELARRMEGTGVTATVCRPGVVRTSFGAEDQAAYIAGVIRVARLFMKTPAQGAATSIYLASSPEVEGITGRYSSTQTQDLQQGLLRHRSRCAVVAGHAPGRGSNRIARPGANIRQSRARPLVHGRDRSTHMNGTPGAAPVSPLLWRTDRQASRTAILIRTLPRAQGPTAGFADEFRGIWDLAPPQFRWA